MDKSALPLLLWLLLQFSLGVAANNKPATHNVSISRDNVFVWFESPLQEETKYDNENLKKMIDLVGGTFGALLINPVTQDPKLTSRETLNDSVLLFPSLVAQHNRKNVNKTLKVIVSFSMPNVTDPKDLFGQGNNSFNSIIEAIKFMADNANSIYPGTVDTLLLLDKDFHPSYKATKNADNNKYYSQSGIHLLQTLKSSRKLLQNELGENTYKLGLFCSFDRIWDNEQIRSEILESVDLIVPQYNLNGIYMDSFRERESLYFEHNYGHLETTIRDMNSDVEIVPLITCDPPTNKDFEEVSIFLNCWQFMSDWAEKYNRSVIMFEAFDQNGDKGKLKDAGWWRLKSEKRSGENRKLDTSFFLAKAAEMYGINIRLQDPLSSEAAIYFDYRVRHRTARNQDYTRKEVKEMLELVSSRFNSIVIGNKRDDDPQNYFIPRIPRLAAELNKEKCKDPSFTPLTIIFNILYNFKSQWNRTDLDWDQTWRAAKKANEIFPGTVRIIAFDKFGKEDADKHYNNFVSALNNSYGNNPLPTTHNMLAATFTNIRIGTYLDLPDCHSFLKGQSTIIRKWISVLILDVSGSVSPKFVDHYMDYKLSSLFAEWRKCQESFKSKYPNVEVLLSVTCSQLVSSGSNEQEAKCWEMVNDWSRTNQVQVIFHQAFETVNGKNGKSPNPVGGWWKLKRSSQLKISRNSFVERLKDLMRDSETTSPDCNEDGTGLNCVIRSHNGLAILFAILVTSCILSIICTVLLCNRRKQPVASGIGELALT